MSNLSTKSNLTVPEITICDTAHEGKGVAFQARANALKIAYDALNAKIFAIAN